MPSRPLLARDQAAVAVLALLTLPLSACLVFDNSTCQSGLICPNGMRCAANQDICIPASPSCGDGIVQKGEACDNGNVLDKDGCSADCKSNESCGNGVEDTAAGEECDTKSSRNGAKCSADCKSLQQCGDGNVDPLEECDDGNDDNDDNCTNSCASAYCGDSFTDRQKPRVEQCDPREDPLHCNLDCTPTQCNDSVVNSAAGEECDPPGNHDGVWCTDKCTFSRCGNGVSESGEECDDGPLSNNDACLNTCKINTCGDGYLNAALEECDNGPGNGAASCPYGQEDCEVCTSACKKATSKGSFCGDGILNSPVEKCDFGPSCGRCIQCNYLEAAPAKGTITLSALVRPGAGSVVVVGDGSKLPVTFKFQDNCGSPKDPFSCTKGDTAHPPSCCVEFGSNNTTLTKSLTEAINEAKAKSMLNITATESPLRVDLKHESAGAGGNQIINTNNTAAFTVSGLSGGIGYSCPSGSPCLRGSDCMPGLICKNLTCQ